MVTNNKYKITVLMPAYNAEGFIAEAIDSILCQTYKDFEFIIINDGSTDNTKDIIASYTDSRIKLISNSINKGLVYCLNYGINIAKGEFIARMDADDKSLKERFEKQVFFMENNPHISILGTSFLYMGTPYIISHPITNDEIRIKLLKDTALAHPTVMMRSNTIRKKKLQYNSDYYPAEDYYLWTECVMNGLKIANLPEVLLEYRQHSSQISTTQQKKQENLKKQIRENYIKFYWKDILSKKDLDFFSENFKNKPLYESYKLINRISRQNEQYHFFASNDFNLFLRQLLYNCNMKIHLYGILKSVINTKNIKFLFTLFNIKCKNISL